MSSLAALQRFATIHRADRETPACELCGAGVTEVHAHLLHLIDQRLQCACKACALLFSGSTTTPFRTVPSRSRVDARFQLREADWEQLNIPVRLAFVSHRSPLQRWVALFPSPAGAMEAELDQEAWRRLHARSRLLQGIESDVEALLVRGKPGRRLDCWVTPIDACYRLVALVRRHWRGFDGGDTARQALDAFFSELNEHSECLAQGPPR